jgi:bile acid:Na+ symporter, BASS family
MTPLLTKLLAGTYVAVDAWGLFVSTVQVVLLPLVIGATLNRVAPKAVARVLPVAPLVSVVTIALIVASILGQNAERIRSSGAILLLAVFLLHASGFALGYLFARLFGFEEQVRRTISIEVGMQNSGLGVVLAQRHFPGTAAAVPCAISSVFHSVIGSLLAGIWRLFPPRPSR